MEPIPHLKPYMGLVERRMEDSLQDEDPRVFGLLWPYIQRGGKRIRPLLCFLTCGALGGRYEDAVEPGALIELFHNFTLIHDDIEDGSQFRRGVPTLHVSHGVPMALNSGDALYTLIWEKLAFLSEEQGFGASFLKGCASSFKRVVGGQGLEIAWIREGRFDITEKEYLEMISGKTSALMGLSCKSGAMISGADKEVSESLRIYGERLGTAFQIHDDVLNLTGSFDRYKKEIGGDIIEGKRTLMVVHALERCSEAERRELISILGKGPSGFAGEEERRAGISQAIGIMEAHGSIAYASSVARGLVDEALSGIGALPPGRDREGLEAIASFVIKRDR